MVSTTANPKKRAKEYVPRWEAYKHFFNIVILRYLVLWFTLVPLFASLLKGLETPLRLPLGGKTLTIALGLPFSWQLLWLSSFFFFLSLVIYFGRCPSFIRKYNNYSEYQSYGHDGRWLAWEAKTLVIERQGLDTLVERLETKKFLNKVDRAYVQTKNPFVDTNQTKLLFEHNSQKFVLAMPILDQEGVVVDGSERGIFWEIFGRYSGSRIWARISILVILACSAVCFLIVLVEHVLAGIREVWTWWG